MYMDNVINDQVVALFQNQLNVRTFMHDKATPHKVRVVTIHLANQGIPVLPWHAKSPDLNPIEHLWDEFERRLRVRPVPPGNLNGPRNALTQEVHFNKPEL